MRKSCYGIAIAFTALAAALSGASAQGAGGAFQPLTVIAPTTVTPTGRPSLDEVLRSIYRQLRSRSENNAVLAFQSAEKLGKNAPPPKPNSVIVNVTLHFEPTTNANGDPAMPGTLEWYVVGPLSCPTPRPRAQGSLPATPPWGAPGDAAPVVASLMTVLEAIATDPHPCTK